MDDEIVNRRSMIAATAAFLMILGTPSGTVEDQIPPSERTVCKPYRTIWFPTSCLQFVARVVCTDLPMGMGVDFKNKTLLEPNGIVSLADDILIRDSAQYFNLKNKTLLEPNGLLTLADNVDMTVTTSQNRIATFLEDSGFPFDFNLCLLVGSFIQEWLFFDLFWSHTYLDYYTGWMGKMGLIVIRAFIAHNLLVTFGTAVCYFVNL